jgi:phosphonate transport system substrate-binding protein
LKDHLGIDVKLYIGDDYTAVIEAMRTKKIDIAYYGPFSYIIAKERAKAVAFAVKATSPETSSYRSLVVVPADSKITKLSELKGKTFLFADPASASGHLYPRNIFLKELKMKNKELEKFFSNISFSGGHDKSILAIAKGNADGAGVCDQCIQRVVDAGLVKASDYRIIAKSEPIPQSPYAYRQGLNSKLVKQVTDFMMDYHNQKPDKGFFRNGTQRFFKVTDKSFDPVRETAKNLDMSPEDMLK